MAGGKGRKRREGVELGRGRIGEGE